MRYLVILFIVTYQGVALAAALPREQLFQQIYIEQALGAANKGALWGVQQRWKSFLVQYHACDRAIKQKEIPIACFDFLANPYAAEVLSGAEVLKLHENFDHLCQRRIIIDKILIPKGKNLVHLGKSRCLSLISE